MRRTAAAPRSLGCLANEFGREPHTPARLFDRRARAGVDSPGVRRRFVSLCALISTVLALGLTSLWIRSYWLADRMIVADQYEITTTPGRLHVARLTAGWFTGVPFLHAEPLNGPQSAAPLFRFWAQHQRMTAANLQGYRGVFFALGLGFQYMHRLTPTPQWVLVEGELPFGFLLLVSGLMPIYWFGTRRSQTVPGRCPACGYDLRSSPTRCPECGTAVAPDFNWHVTGPLPEGEGTIAATRIRRPL